MRPIVVGLGQPTAGDDAVGILVARALEARGIEAVASTDASVLLTLLEEGRPIVLVDAVVGGGAPGDVLLFRPDALDDGPRPISSHGLGVSEALGIARVLYGPSSLGRVEIVGVVVRPEPELSPPVAAAVERAASLAERLCARGA